MTEYTPGPWKIRDRGVDFSVCAKNGHEINYRTNEANARLIAAAPELLAALELVLPLAKGYVATHNVGSNAKYIEDAILAIVRAKMRVSAYAASAPSAAQIKQISEDEKWLFVQNADALATARRK